MVNPLRAWREQMGLTVSQLSILAHVSADTIRNSEVGKSVYLSAALEQVINRLGGSYGEMSREYDEWRRQIAIHLLNGGR